MKRVCAGLLLTAAILFAGAGCPDGQSDTATAPAPEGGDAEILPQSDDRALERNDLVHLDNWRLTLARNEIFARHGRPFQNEHIREHFEGVSWYTPDEDYSDAWLSKVERENAEFIVEYQKITYDMPASNP